MIYSSANIFHEKGILILAVMHFCNGSKLFQKKVWIDLHMQRTKYQKPTDIASQSPSDEKLLYSLSYRSIFSRVSKPNALFFWKTVKVCSAFVTVERSNKVWASMLLRIRNLRIQGLSFTQPKRVDAPIRG